MTTRRKVLAGLLGSTLAACPGLASALALGGQGVPWEPGAANPPEYGTQPARILTAAERRLLEAIVERLIPSDETGPGAVEAGVAEFIDRQLAGFYGEGRRWYMRGPFAADPLDTQGYQFPGPPRELIRAGLAGFAAAVRAEAGADFEDLTSDSQDRLLETLEDGELDLAGVDGAYFFKFLHEMTIEGFFCDPVYGGNRNMAGWRLVGFPGARYDYRDFVDHGGARIDLPPVGLTGRPGWRD